MSAISALLQLTGSKPFETAVMIGAGAQFITETDQVFSWKFVAGVVAGVALSVFVDKKMGQEFTRPHQGIFGPASLKSACFGLIQFQLALLSLCTPRSVASELFGFRVGLLV